MKKIKCMLDKTQYNSKPSGFETGLIQKKLVPTEISLEDLAKYLSMGATFKPALLNGTKNVDWISQQIFALDFDEGTSIQEELDRCKQLDICPAFGYTSFSHTEATHKFRLVFATDKVITDINVRNTIQKLLINIFPTSDSVTFEPSRLFYGGKNLIGGDYDYRINADKFLEKYKDSSENFSFLTTNKKDTSNISCIISSVKAQIFERVEYIKTLNVDKLKESLKTTNDKIICINKQQVYDAIYHINLEEFIGISGMVNCILPSHPDNDPSAHIYITDSGTPIYKCFGCGEKHTIISLVERLAQCKRLKAIEFIKSVYNIELQQSEWQKEQLEIFDINIELLLSDEFQELYPALNSLIKTRKANLIALHSFIKINLLDETYTVNDLPVFFASLNKLLEVFSTMDKKKVSQSLTLFSLLNLIRKVPHKELPSDLSHNAKTIANKYDFNKLTNFYSISDYGEQSLKESNEIAENLKSNNITLCGLSREYVLRTFGEKKANEIFPQYTYHNKRGTSKKSDDITEIIASAILKEIEEKGYVLEKEIKVSYQAELQWKRSIQEILNKNGLVKITADKSLKEKYNINVPQKSYPKIIIKRSELDGRTYNE